MTSPAAYPDGLQAFLGMGDPLPAPDTELGRFFEGLSVRMPDAAVRALDGMGVPPGMLKALVLCRDLAVARVAIGKAGLFEFDGPDAALLIAVREHGQVIDICAARSAAPDEWAVLRGDGWVLGHGAFLRCLLDGTGTLRVHGNPMAWLVGGCVGICVLDWSAAAVGALRGLGPGVTLQCADARAADVLARALAWDGLPKVAVRPAQTGSDIQERIAA